MRRLLAVCLITALCVSCTDDHVRLRRGPLGPATYGVRFDVSGAPAVRTEAVTARLRVTQLSDGAELRLDIADETPVTTRFRRMPNGRLELDSVEGLSPSSAGEADLASIVSQLDPPLSKRPVRLRQWWQSSRRVSTGTLEANLESTLRIVRFTRIAGNDAAEVQGTVTGTLRTTGTTGQFAGSVRGTTRIAWALEAGRVLASHTELVWDIPNVGTVDLNTTVRPG